MRLIKRRSAPVIPQYPPPSTSTTSLVDISRTDGGTVPIDIPIPLPPKSSSVLDVRLPSSTSSAPTLGVGGVSAAARFAGTEFLEAHNPRGNDIDASRSDDEGRRRASQQEASAQDGADDAKGKKRDSTGQNRYPPNSLVPGTGWGFGRMRRSRKQDVKVLPPLRRDSLSWKAARSTASPSPACRVAYSEPSTPVPPTPSRSPLQADLTGLPNPLLPTRPAYRPVHSQPILTLTIPSSTTQQSAILDADEDQETLLTRSTTSSSLTRSVSLSETVTRGDSSMPLLQRHRRSASLGLPRLRRGDSPTPRKLQKRRDGSRDPTTTLTPLPDDPPVPRRVSVGVGQSATLTHLASERKEESGTYAAPPSLPEGAEPPIPHSTSSWSLNRNSSTSTQASSMIAPSTDESTVLTPPYDPFRDQRLSGKWDALHIPFVGDSGRSRSSTMSYSVYDGKKESPDEIVDMRQMLFESLMQHDDAGSVDEALKEHSLHMPSLSTMRSISDTTATCETAGEGARTIAPTPSAELQSLSSGMTSRPGSRTRDLTEQHPAASRDLVNCASNDSLTDSPAQTTSSTSTPQTVGPLRRFRRGQGHTRSRASSLSALSATRGSTYSVGEIDVADHGAMTRATIVRLPDTTGTPVAAWASTPALEPAPPATRLFPPDRPGNKRSHSDLGETRARGLLPFLSRESLRSHTSIVTSPPQSRLRAVPSLEIITSPVDAIPDDAFSPSPLSATSSRASSLGRLWRKLSVGRKKSRTGSSTSIDTGSAVNLPKSRSCVDVTPGTNLLESPITFRAPLDEVIPEVPSPGPRSSSLLASQLRGGIRNSDLSFGSSASASSTTSFDLPLRKPIAQRTSSLSTPPSVVVSDHSGSYFPSTLGLTGSLLPRAAEPPSTSTIIEGVAFTATPEVDAREASDYIAHVTPPRSARRPADRRPRFSMGAGPPTAEEKRRYRQTLVDIQDDVVFHQVLQDLARLDRQTDDAGAESGAEVANVGDANAIDRRPSWKADKGEIRAWFVTRELVQGERRHGRLLARGVATVQAAAESRRDEVPPLPTSISSSQSAVSLHAMPSKQSFLYRRHPNSRSSNSVSQSHSSTASSSSNLSSLSITTPSPKIRAKLPLPPPSPTASPLDLLLERLPRLLALSLTLSSRFEDDPSPHGVAEAFIKMEDEMTREIGLWAGEVGNIVAVGMGDMLDMTNGTRGRSARRSISGDAPVEEEDQEDRLGFADIIIMPIQRAARYKLLFQEMITMTDITVSSNESIRRAVGSAERLAEECDRRQAFDLHAMRRQINSPQQAKKGKKRSKSVVSVHNVNGAAKERSWVPIRTASEA